MSERQPLGVFHETLVEKVWACSQSTEVGVRLHVIDAGVVAKFPLNE